MVKRDESGKWSWSEHYVTNCKLNGKSLLDWGRHPTWTFDESAFLSIGIDPDTISIEQFADHESDLGPHNNGYEREHFELVDEFATRTRIMARAIETEELQEPPFRPKNFLEWLDAKGLSYLPELKEAVEKYGRAPEEIRNEKWRDHEMQLTENALKNGLPQTAFTAEKPLQERERNAHLRLIGALASIILERHAKGKSATIRTQEALIVAISDKFEGDGLSQSSIQKKIAEGIRLLESSKRDDAA